MATPEEYLENLLHYVSTRLGWLAQELERLQRRLARAGIVGTIPVAGPAPLPQGARAHVPV
jgi:hypothetical protein